MLQACRVNYRCLAMLHSVAEVQDVASRGGCGMQAMRLAELRDGRGGGVMQKRHWHAAFDGFQPAAAWEAGTKDALDARWVAQALACTRAGILVRNCRDMLTNVACSVHWMGMIANYMARQPVLFASAVGGSQLLLLQLLLDPVAPCASITDYIVCLQCHWLGGCGRHEGGQGGPL